MPTLVPLFGIASLFFCPVFGIFAWYFANQDMRAPGFYAMSKKYRQSIQVGKWMGIFGIFFWTLGIIFIFVANVIAWLTG